MNKEANFSLLHHNTFGIQACCKCFIDYSSIQELEMILKDKELNKMQLLHIGGGSNLLFLSDFPGLVLHSSIKEIEIVEETDDSVLVRVGSGVKWDDFVSYCVNHNFYGAENLSYIPGEVGAAPVQNVGAYGVEAKDIIKKVEVVECKTGQKHIIEGADCGFAYRYSNFKGPWKDRYFVHHVIFELNKKPQFKLEYGKIGEMLVGKDITLNSIRDAIIAIRKEKLPDPEVIGSAGSFFKNPVVPIEKYRELSAKFEGMPYYAIADGLIKIPAGWLIEQCGWKGKDYKHVGVYEKQSLIIVNRGGATGHEVAELAEKIQNDVNKKFGIEISPEVCYIG